MNTTPITAADYQDWCHQNGLYVHNVSHADRYRTYQQKISPAGVALRVVDDFLQCHAGTLDLQAWRNNDVYEIGPDAAARIELTAKSLETIGAPRAAAKIRTLRDTSLGGMFAANLDNPGAFLEQMQNVDVQSLMQEFRDRVARAMPDMAAKAGLPISEKKPGPLTAEIESKEQIEHLLDQFLHSHQTDLRADYAKHGDVRTRPGFDPDQRARELDGIRRTELDRELQADDALKLEACLQELEKILTRNPDTEPSKVGSRRRELLGIYRKYAQRPEGEIVPKLAKALNAATKLQKQFPEVFDPKPTQDATLLAELAAIGAYEVDPRSKRTTIHWPDPNGIPDGPATFSLSLDVPTHDDSALAEALQTWGVFLRKFPEYLEPIRAELLDSFERYQDIIDEEDFEFEGDIPTDRSLFQGAGAGSLTIEHTPDGINTRAFFHVEWDDEHGAEIFLDVEPEAAPAPRGNTGSADPADAGLLPKFETDFGVSLPPGCRHFLAAGADARQLVDNAKVKLAGVSQRLKVQMFRSLGEVEDAYVAHLAADFPAEYLPIGRANVAEGGAGFPMPIFLNLGKKKSGSVMIAPHPLEDMTQFLPPFEGVDTSAAVRAMFPSLLQVLAKDFDTWLAKLTVESAGF